MVAQSGILAAMFAALTVAAPASNLVQRAGGPVAKPIPDTCTVDDPYESSTSAPSAFIPAASSSEIQLYAMYYPPYTSNSTQMAQQCLEQCYGYGDSTECKGAYWANQVLVPEGYYGSGTLETACVFYTRALAADDLVAAPEGQGTDAKARNIVC